MRIVPFPPEADDTTFSRLGWLQMISGPINTVINVRSTSQLERNQMALEMYQELLKARQGEPEIRVAKFQFRNSQGSKVDPPLSWRLSRTQKAAVQSAWQAITAESAAADNPLRIIGDWFTAKP